MQQGPLQAGQVVADKYVVERELGRGGMGAVYVVRHRATGKPMALKCLLPELLQNAEFVARFLREAQVGGTVHHRNVIDVFDVGRDADVLYLVMELLDGKPLTALLQDEFMTLEQALLIILRAMEGVAAVHAHGIIHRDLKPDNIFVTYGTDGRLDHPKVLDFGISKLGGAGQGSLTQSGMALGTPYYMCVEQLSGRRDLDQRVDVYAMGVILYEAIAGVLPYWADSISALAIKLLTEQPAHLQQLRPDLPPGLASVIMRAMSLERERRQPTLQALIEELRPFVPQAASVRLPEGSGRPLRTPRSDSARHDERETVSLPLIVPRASQDAPERAADQGNQAAPPTRTPRARLGRGAVLLVGALLTGGAGLLAWLQHRAGDANAAKAESAAGNGPAPQPPSMPRAEATPTPAVGPSPVPTESASPPAPDAGTRSAAAAPPSTPTAQPTGAETSARTHDGHRSKPRHGAAAAPAPAASPVPPPSAPAKPTEPAEAPAQGRAGVLGKGDFQ
ncbi:MAG TPA: protein kinase [Polyangiales bacterium]